MEMVFNREENGSACASRKDRDELQHVAPAPAPPLPPPLGVPPPPCVPTLSSLTLSDASSSVLKTRARLPTPSDVRSHNAALQKEEVHTGIQKLLSWGLSRGEEHESLWLASNRHTASVLQQGPECGIAALCMAINMLEPYLCLKADKRHIIGTAKEKGFTLQGEMFSARNMLELTSCVSKASGKILNGNMVDNRYDIISHLANGWPVLAPYDKDGNCEPCCKRGHKAHWAVLTGFALQRDTDILSDLNSSHWQQDSVKPNLYLFTTNDQTSCGQAVRTILSKVPVSDIYVLARQGKSSHVHPWGYLGLSESNSNLIEPGANIVEEIHSFVIPEGGLQEGLCNQVVLIRP